MRTTMTIAVLALGLGACSSPGPRADRIVYRTSEAIAPRLASGADPLMTTSSPAPQNDIPEEVRVAWLRENQPAPPPAPRVQQVIVERRNDTDWVIPAIYAIGVGASVYYTKRHYDRHGHHSYGHYGHGYHGGWGWGWGGGYGWGW